MVQADDNKVSLEVTPSWFEPVKPIPKEAVRLPLNYDAKSKVQVRTYDCLSLYRSLADKTEKIDFVENPFHPDIKQSETLVVVLNELVHQLGSHLTFTKSNLTFDDSDYRSACGVMDLGSIHSFLASEGKFQTAKFNLHLKLDYKQLTRAPETMKDFVLRLTNDIALIAECDKSFVRVFNVKSASSITVEVGITARTSKDTTEKADKVKISLNTLNHIYSAKIPMLKDYLIAEPYEYELEPALAILQLKVEDFNAEYNRAYTDSEEDKRGGYPYYLPHTWYRHGLRVDDKFPGDEAWLGMTNGPGEWAVAYHGTESMAAKGIVGSGLKHSSVARDVMEHEAKQQNPSIPDTKGIYVATHCEDGASLYAKPFPLLSGENESKSYRLVFQCRVQPGKFTKHSFGVNRGHAWRVFDEKAVRPYGLLLKHSTIEKAK